MKLRHLLLAFIVSAGSVVMWNETSARSFARVRTVPKESKEEKKKEDEQKATTTPKLTPSTASIIVPAPSKSSTLTRTCSQSNCAEPDVELIANSTMRK